MARRKHKKKQVPIRSGEQATPERCRKFGGVIREVVDRDADGKVYMLRYRVRVECILDSYLLRKLISDPYHEAGSIYRMHYLRGILRLIAKNPLSPNGGKVSFEETRLISLESQRILKEANQVLTPAQRKIVEKVCGDDQQAGGTDALETLRRGLERLAEHFGIV